MDSVERNQLVPIAQPRAALSGEAGKLAVLPGQARDLQAVWTSYDMLLPAEQLAAVNAGLGDDGRLADLVGQTVEVEHCYFHLVELVNEKDGESEDAVRSVLITPEGKRLAACSKGITSAMKTLLRAFPATPWKPPLRVVVVQRPRRSGPGKVLSLDLAAVNTIPPNKKGK